MEYKPSFVDQLDVDYIAHHGIKGQKWGIRRYQNSDGSLTPAGKKRYRKSIDYIDRTTDGLQQGRNAANDKYAISKNNYDAATKLKKERND